MSADIAESLLRARRALDDLSPRISTEDWLWDDSIDRWCLAFTAHLERPVEIPGVTRWVFTVSPDYPNCKVGIYPAVIGGIEDTHPHQSNNGLEGHGKYCRSGNVCLFTERAEWEMRGDSDFTLLSHAERFLEWLEGANEETLMKSGDRVEFPMQRIGCAGAVLYLEDDVSKMIWDSPPASRDGVLETFENHLGQTCLSSFRGADGNLVYSAGWGSAFGDNEIVSTGRGIWFIAPSIPHVRCWQSPNTYGELREWAGKEGIDLDGVIARNASGLRDGARHLLAIGVPCPDSVGEDPQSLSWFVAKMPRLANEREFKGGGVHDRKVLKTIDRQKYLSSGVRVDWIDSVNCSKEQMHSRGGLCDELADSRIAIIGVGSLGSLVADCLVRGGATDLCVFDSDKFEMGNVTRHLLGSGDVGARKSTAVATALNATSPTAAVESGEKIDKDSAAVLRKFDIIIDCSSSPKVRSILDGLKGGQRLFVCSFGYAAERVYVSASLLGSFSSEEYQKTFEGLMREDAEKIEEEGLPWEGTGCWSPVFPARHSDVSRAASLAVDCIDRMTERRKAKANYAYVMKRDEDGFLLGVDRMEL